MKARLDDTEGRRGDRIERPRRNSALGRISGFALNIGLSTILGLFALWLLNVSLGATDWGRIVLVQTVGQMAGILVAFGWGATGAAIIAGTPANDRHALYRDSLRIRVILYVVTLPLTVALLFLLFRGDLLVALIGAAAYLLPSLGGAWYFIGEGRPLRLFLCDTVPMMAGNVLGVALAMIGGEAWMYLLGQGLGFFAAVVIDAVVILRGAPNQSAPPARILATLQTQRHAATASLTTSLYVSLPMIAVQTFVPALQPLYAIADRLFRYASIALQPILQFFQSWVPVDPDDLPRRARLAMYAGILLGAVGGIAIAFLSPILSQLLTAGNLHVPLELSIPFGVAFVGIGISALVGYACLIAVGKVRTLAVSTLIAAGIGAPLIVLFAVLGSVPYIAWAVAISELCVAGWQVVVLLRALRDSTVGEPIRNAPLVQTREYSRDDA